MEGFDYEGYKTKNGLRMRNMDCLFTGDFIVFWQREYRGTKTDRIAEWIENDLNIPVEGIEKACRTGLILQALCR